MKLHCIEYGRDEDLPASVRAAIPDQITRHVFRASLNRHLASGSSEMHSYLKAYRELEKMGYDRREGKWIAKDALAASDVHVPGPLGRKEKDDPGTDEADVQEFEDVVLAQADLYIPPKEVRVAASAALAGGYEGSAKAIAKALSCGEGVPLSTIKQIAWAHETFEKFPSELVQNAWGGTFAKKWCDRVVKKFSADPWIGVDLDKTLAHYAEFEGPEVIGKPIPEMVDRVKGWLADGKTVKIFTARVADDPDGKAKAAIENWCEENLGRKLEVTNAKDHGMTELWDDRAVQVEPNEGSPVAKAGGGVMLALWPDEETAKKLAVDGGEAWDELHVTLAYFGKLDEIDMNALPGLEQAVSRFASARPPLRVVLGGLGRFPATPQSDGQDVAYLGVHSPDIQKFRQDLVDCAEVCGVSPKKNFGYTPHMTLKYLAPHAPSLLKTPDHIDCAFDKVVLSVGSAKKEYALDGVGKWDEEEHPRDDHGRFGEGSGGEPIKYAPSDKMVRAMQHQVLCGVEKQRIADQQEEKLAKAVGIPRTKDNSAFDLNDGKIAVELKTMVDSKNGKITMSKDALARKNAEIKSSKVRAYTVVADKRAGNTSYYYSKGVGSFRVSSMTPTTLAELKGILHGR